MFIYPTLYSQSNVKLCPEENVDGDFGGGGEVFMDYFGILIRAKT